MEYTPGDTVSFRPYNAYMVERYGADAILSGVIVRRNRASLTVNMGGIATVPLTHLL